MTKSEAIKKLISTATKYNGYSEGAGNSNRFSTYMGHPAEAWCDDYADAIFKETFGQKNANKMLYGGCGQPYTPTSAQCFKNAGAWTVTDPQVGDQIFFKNSSRICHTGIVIGVSGSTVSTIEGNTSPMNGVDPNGGGVYKKSYSRSNSRIAGYGRPKWSVVADGTTSGSTSGSSSTYQMKVSGFKKMLRNNYGNTIKTNTGHVLSDSEAYGKQTRAAALCAVKFELQKHVKDYKFDLRNTNFGATCKKYAGKYAIVQNGSNTAFVALLQGMLRCMGYYKGALDAIAGDQTVAAIKAFQRDRGLVVDGVAGAETWYALFN